MRGIQRDQPGIVVIGAFHGAGAQPENQAQHARAGVDILVPSVRIEGKPDRGKMGKVQVPVKGACDPLHQDGHLLVPLQQAVTGPVIQGIFAQGARIDPFDGIDQLFEARAAISPVTAENTLVLAREGVAETVFEQAAGPDDDGRFAEVIQHVRKAPHDVGRKSAVQNTAPHLGGDVEAAP
ncbi:MAG: hypothetical protein BWY25_03214 [Chloroflexi bacterium ADurb.Bin222]|nr:MAG: hypothetical protein BWY25_03214 [Chloroflexi bacterium ADurb.Bin222]